MKLRYFSIMIIFLARVAAPQNPGAFVPDDAGEDAEVIQVSPGSRKAKSSTTIVIDGARLGVNDAATTPTDGVVAPRGNWWTGFETAYRPEEFMRALLERYDHRYVKQDRAGEFLKLLEDREYKKLFEALRDDLRKVHANPILPEDVKKTAEAQLLSCLGVFHLRTYNPAWAEEAFLEALERKPDDGVARMLLAESYALQGRFDLAEETLDPLMSSAYFPVQMNAALSRIYQHKNQIRRALSHWKRVLDRVPEDRVDFFRLPFLKSELYVQRRFKSYSTSRYVVKYDPVLEENREKVLTPILSMVDEARWRLNRRFNLEPEDRAVIVIYGSESMRELFGGLLGGLEAFFSMEDAKLRVGVTSVQPDDVQALRPVIFHEYVHRLIHYVTRGRLKKRWIHEGLATYYEREAAGSDRYEGWELERPIDLDSLMEYSINPRGYYRSRRAMDYVMGRYGEARVMEFLKLVGQGKPMNAAMEEGLGVDYDRLKKEVSRIR